MRPLTCAISVLKPESQFTGGFSSLIALQMSLICILLDIHEILAVKFQLQEVVFNQKMLFKVMMS